MKALQRKLWRDLWHMRGQALAVAMIVASGIASFVTARSAYDSLWNSHIEYYRDYRFADVFASLTRAPLSVAPRIARIPGVEAVEARVVRGVTLDVPGLDDVATARLISVPDRGQPDLNRLHVRTGRYLDPSRARRSPGERRVRGGEPPRAREYSRCADQRAMAAPSRGRPRDVSRVHLRHPRTGPASRTSAVWALCGWPSGRWPEPSTWRGLSTMSA